MKKITSLLMLFCMCIGMAWADPTDLPEITTDLNNPIYYTIYNTRSSQPGGLMYYAGDEVGMKDGGSVGVSIQDKYKFYFTGSHDALYVHNAATGKKLAAIGNGNKSKGSWTDEGTEWAVGVSPKGGGLAFGPKGGLNGNSCWNECNYNTGEGNPDFTTWSANDAGSIFVVNKVDEWIFPETGKFYVIECPLFYSVQGVQKGLYVKQDGTPAWGTVDLTNRSYYWIPTVNEDGTVALKNVQTNSYLNGTTMSETVANASITALGANQFSIVVNGVTVHANQHSSGMGAGSNIVSWTTTANNASAWTFVEKDDPDAVQEVTVNYTFTYEGDVKYTQSTKTLIGEEYPAFTVVFPYGVSATKPTGTIVDGDVVAGVVTKEIELSVELPFVPAEDYESVENWYYVQMHSSGGTYARYLQDMTDYIEWLDVEMNVEEADSYTWAFVGNVFDGFILVNYAAGAEKGVNSDGADNPALGDIETATQWQIKGSRVNRDSEHFCFQYPGSNKYMNAQNGKVAFWSDNDQGSTMWVTERDLTGATELQAYIDEVEAMIETGVAADDAVGYVSFYSLTEVGIALTAAKKAVESKEGCVDALQELQAAVNAVETIQPEEGEFYIISSAMPSEDSRSGKRVYVNNTAGMQFWNEDAISNVFQFVSDGNEDDDYEMFYLKSVERGTYVSTANTHAGGQVIAEATEITDAKPIAIANMGRANVVSLIPQGGAMIHAQEAYSYVVAWNNTDNEGASAWIITKVDIADYAHTLTVDESGWASLVLGYNATIPSNVKVYTVSSVGENVANLTEVTGVIPANEPVLVNAAAGNYDFYYTEAEQSELNNLLEGTIFDTNIPLNAYVLSTKNDVFGFYKAMLNQENSTAFKNNALKAYLPATSEARFLNINFDTETGINSVDVVNGKAEVYDLSGRRVKKVQKGLYIINGLKVVK